MRRSKARAAVAVEERGGDVETVCLCAKRLALSSLELLGAVRFADSNIEFMNKSVTHKLTDFVEAVESLSLRISEDTRVACRELLRLGLVATKATMAAVATGEWRSPTFDEAEMACGELVRAQEELAARFDVPTRA